MSRRTRLVERIRRRAGSAVVEQFFSGASRVGRLHPRARPERHGVEVIRDVAYGPRPEHRLDVYRPRDLGPDETAPALLYVHGGGFRILSKDTHWIMALAFAREGYCVFNIDYRLAPEHPFPAALEDTSEALAWLADHAAQYGARLDDLVLAGESAGANLVTALSVMCSYERPEPFARRAFEVGVTPVATVAKCGLLQVSDVGRFRARRPDISRFLEDRLEEVTRAYLAGAPGPLDLADPLLVLERGDAPTRPLPRFFVSVGTRDPILDDSRRLASALDALGVPNRVRYYPGEVHAFQAFVWRRNARRCWQDTYEFLDAAQRGRSA